jgi:hypothetical protein
MGVIHYAYSFNRKLVGLDIAECFGSEKQVTASAYEAKIAQAHNGREGLAGQFLEDLCFDQEDWTSETSGNSDRTQKLIKILLAKRISGVRKLSQSSFALLELLLPMLGWEKQKIRLLLMGRQFNHLAESIGFLDSDLHGRHIDRSPSWLAFDDVQMLSVAFQSLREQFMHPTTSCLEAADAANSRIFWGRDSSPDLIKNAFSEMTGRFALCEHTGHDLLLVNEVASYQNAPIEPI